MLLTRTLVHRSRYKYFCSMGVGPTDIGIHVYLTVPDISVFESLHEHLYPYHCSKLKRTKRFLALYLHPNRKRVSTLTIAGRSRSRSGRMSHGSREKDGKNESDNCHHHH